VSEIASNSTHSCKSVRVSAPARLHLGFLDLNGTTSRKFGSIGLAVNSHSTSLTAQGSEKTSISSPVGNEHIATRAESIIQSFYQTLGQAVAKDNRGVKINFEQLIPEHAGFGSGTQLNLAIGTALCKLHGIKASTQEIAASLGRGARSGIGISTFDLGGFIVDGGLKPNTTVPPLLMHQHFPRDWRIVLIMDNQHQGVHGQQEKTAFTKLPPFPLQNSQAICHLSLMQLLPALVEQDVEQFGNALTQIQNLIGDHFAPAQGGRYTSELVAQLLKQSLQLGHSGIAQTSWGPTGCVFVESQQQAENLVENLTTYTGSTLESDRQATFFIAQANESGAKTEICTV
jgi:beta-ribofuranosylaminobenzene 5'-phosphate synthase